MESDDFTRHYIIGYLNARELVLRPLVGTSPSLSSYSAVVGHCLWHPQ